MRLDLLTLLPLFQSCSSSEKQKQCREFLQIPPTKIYPPHIPCSPLIIATSLTLSCASSLIFSRTSLKQVSPLSHGYQHSNILLFFSTWKTNEQSKLPLDLTSPSCYQPISLVSFAAKSSRELSTFPTYNSSPLFLFKNRSIKTCSSTTPRPPHCTHACQGLP